MTLITTTLCSAFTHKVIDTLILLSADGVTMTIPLTCDYPKSALRPASQVGPMRSSCLRSVFAYFYSEVLLYARVNIKYMYNKRL